MQEEVENRTINLAISTTKLTGRSIVAGIRKYMQHREKVKARKGTRDTAVHGKAVRETASRSESGCCQCRNRQRAVSSDFEQPCQEIRCGLRR